MIQAEYEKIFNGLEPQSKAAESTGPYNEMAARVISHSCAISLKRIADTLAEGLELAYAIRNNR